MRHSPLPFAFLRITKDLIAWAEADVDGWEKSATPPSRTPYFWAPDFFLKDSKPFLIPSHFAFLSPSEARKRLENLQGEKAEGPRSPLFPHLHWDSSSKEDFRVSFLDLFQRFDEQRLEKAVPVIIDRARPEPGTDLKKFLSPSLLEMFDLLMELPEGLMPFFLVDEEWIFGATPETLLRQSGGTIHTQAVAGTTFDKDKSLLQDPKERHEHEVVIQEIKKLLSPLGEVHCGVTYEKNLPRLKHLVTEIQLTPFTDSSLIKTALTLHPTPALGGSPQKSAFTWLEHQPSGRWRRRYGAPFGFVTEQGEGHIVVAIRALQIVQNELLSIAGAGVVKESRLESEWREMHDKKDWVLQLFGVK